MRRAADFTEQEAIALAKSINQFRLWIKKECFTPSVWKYWLSENPGEENIPTGKNYLSEYSRRGILEQDGKDGYRFRKFGTDPISAHEIAVAIKATRKKNSEANRRWAEKKKEKEAPQSLLEETEEVHVPVVVTDPIQSAISLLKANGYRILKPRVEYDEV